MKKRAVKIVSILFVILMLSILCLPSQHLFGLRVNVSKSLPYKFFVSLPVSDIQRGDYVSLDHPNSSIPLAKQVIGLPGDTVSIQGKTICINGEKIGKVREKSDSGNVYTPLVDSNTEIIIDPCYLFVYASHEKSFDSRYREFGLINIEQIQERLWPVF